MRCVCENEPQPNPDITMNYEDRGFAVAINPASVPTLPLPYIFNSESPILPLSQSLLSGQSHGAFKDTTFPILLDLFHPKIELQQIPPKCDKCHSFITGLCPFCNLSQPAQEKAIAISEPQEPSIFIFVLLGNNQNEVYESLAQFQYPFILLNYDSKFTALIKSGEKYFHACLFDSPLPPNSVIRDPISPIPHFPENEMHKVDFNEVMNSLQEILPKFGVPTHIVFMPTIPHTCLTQMQVPNSTFSVLSSHSFNCQCHSITDSTGGLFLPYRKSLNIDNLTDVRSIQVQTSSGKVDYLNHPLLVYPGMLVSVDSLKCESNSQQTIQISIKTENYQYIFTRSFTPQLVTTFLYNMSFPNTLIAKNFHFNSVISANSRSKNSYLLPHALRYYALFDPKPEKQTISKILDWRPFILQFKPIQTVVPFSSDKTLTTISISVIVYNSMAIIFVGSQVTKEDFYSLVGANLLPGHMPFDLNDTGYQSPLWDFIRSLQQLLYPLPVPITVVPGESGRAIELKSIVDCDFVDGFNMIFKKFSQIC